jgi:hypothetical protein
MSLNLNNQQQATKKSKYDWNDGDVRFCYVKWTSGKDKYDVMPMSSLVKHETYSLEQKYKIKYKDAKIYEATLLFIGKIKILIVVHLSNLSI